MKTGFLGTYVMSWSQTEIEGFRAPTVGMVAVGACWSWRGAALRMDGPHDVLRLDRSAEAAQLRQRAARMVQRLVGSDPQAVPVAERRAAAAAEDAPLADDCIVLTDGTDSYTATVIDMPPGRDALLMFVNELPPSRRDLWVVRHSLSDATTRHGPRVASGLTCFATGTAILTPDGARAVENLREGDLIVTRDDGAKPVRWIGRRHFSGARLFAMPALRPVRFSAGALGGGRPFGDLLVSPQHRVLIRGDVAQSLFNTDEVLVAARDLVNGATITIDTARRDVTYHHLMLERHQIIWANTVETESFHPASVALDALDEGDRRRLLALRPELKSDPQRYGDYARRALTMPEAAILRHAA